MKTNSEAIKDRMEKGHVATAIQIALTEEIYKDPTSSADYWARRAAALVPGLDEYSNGYILQCVKSTMESVKRMRKLNEKSKPSDVEFDEKGKIRRLSASAQCLILHDVQSIVLGEIRASDPCTVGHLMFTCIDQVFEDKYKVDFKKLTQFNQVCLIDEAVRNLIKLNQIITEISYDEDNDIFETTYRQA
jgi:hypothetical protein